MTQALIKSWSKAKYYSPHEENKEDLDGAGDGERDELGLIRAICVKVCVVIGLKLGCFPERTPGPVTISTEGAFQRIAGRKKASFPPTLA